MQVRQLRAVMESKYNVVCFENLADYNQNSALLYQLFHRHYQQAYEHQQRLILYCAGEPSPKLIAHIKRAADVIDISHCFILICCNTNNPNGFEQLELFKVNIDSEPLAPDQLIDLDQFCPMPFASVSVHNQGRAKCCCVFESPHDNVQTSNLQQVFYHPSMQSLRQQFVQGIRPQGCSHCWQLEDNNLPSHRQWYLPHYEKSMFVEDWIGSPQIRIMDVRPSNVCNFKCRVCGPSDSSLYAVESLTHAKSDLEKSAIKNILIQGQWFDDNPNLFDQIIQQLDYIQHLEFYGGEPFLLKQLPKIFSAAIELGVANRIDLHFNTNGSIWPDKILDQLSRFKKVEIAISIDNIEDRFELERGGQWDVIQRHVIRYQQLGHPFEISVMPLVNVQNVLYLPELVDWAEKHKLKMLFQYLDQPQYLNIDTLTLQAKQLVISKLTSHGHPELKNIAERIQSSQGSDGVEFVTKMKQFDKYRNQDFYLSHSAIAEAMGYML